MVSHANISKQERPSSMIRERKPKEQRNVVNHTGSELEVLKS